MNVLAVGCHPDDLEIGCGGTLAQLSKLGHQVTMYRVAGGDKGHVVIPQKSCAAYDIKAKDAGALIDAQVRNLNVPDLQVKLENEDLNRALIRLVREVKPDFIITHNPEDYMKDHQEVSKDVFDASFYASVPHMLPESPVYSAIFPISYMDTEEGIDLCP